MGCRDVGVGQSPSSLGLHADARATKGYRWVVLMVRLMLLRAALVATPAITSGGGGVYYNLLVLVMVDALLERLNALSTVV